MSRQMVSNAIGTKFIVSSIRCMAVFHIVLTWSAVIMGYWGFKAHSGLLWVTLSMWNWFSASELGSGNVMPSLNAKPFLINAK